MQQAKSYKHRAEPQETNSGMKSVDSKYKRKTKQDINGSNKTQEQAKKHIQR